MLPALLRNNTASSSALRVGPGCVAYLGRAVSLRLFSAETPQAPHEKLETISEVAVDPFLASLQQKTERDLFEILRKQQQQPASQSSDDEESKVYIRFQCMNRQSLCF